MSVQPDTSHTAQIVDMIGLLDLSCRRREAYLDKAGNSARLLSIRKYLRYKASIGFDDIEALQESHSKSQLARLRRQVRSLLDAEFGRLRVYRYRQGFSVAHHNLEGLIGGLLRVQYFARQIRFSEQDAQGKRHARAGLPLAWGVGGTVVEADKERLRRRRSKR